MSHQLQRLTFAMLAACLGLALTSGYWSLLRRDALTARLDNPRRVLMERRVRRGPILDRAGRVLAESVGQPGAYERSYLHPALAPVLGYVSLAYGTSGIEAAYDGVLHGDLGQDPLDLFWRNSLLGVPAPGRGVQLTLDMRLQQQADQALGERAGAVVLLDARTGDLLALASHPSFDPSRLEADWAGLISDPRAPLLNRTTFALYQPGGLLAPVILAGALRSGLAELDQPFPAAGAEIGVGALRLGCRTPPPVSDLTLAEAFQLGCPWPLAELGGRLGAAALDQLFSDFRFYQPARLPIPTTAAAPPDLVVEAPIAAVGQGALTLTPLHAALAAAAIARRGELPAPRLVLAVESVGGTWQAQAAPDHTIAAMSPDAAEAVKALMPDGYSAVALTGAAGQTLAWFIDFSPFEYPRFAVAVLLETGDELAARAIGARLLESAVDALP